MFDTVKRFLALDTQLPPPTQARAIDSFTDHPGLEAQIAAAFSTRRQTTPWTPATVRDAMGVPAIHRAVTLISNTGGALSLEAWRGGAKLPDEERPRVIVRPDPFRTPRDFHRDTLYSMATRGEAWWWVARRDANDLPLSLIVVPAYEVNVTENPADLRYPEIRWRDKVMANRDMRQITLLKEPGELRGYGPLQACGAAVSIAVESQEWAANFFASGGYPNIWIKAAGDLSGGLTGDPDAPDAEPDDWMSEVQRLKAQWMETTPNTPRVTDEGIIDIKQFDPNPQGAQMLDARTHQDGDAARMFGIPGALLEYAAAGTSLTYQNLAEVMTNFLRTCLIPNYLEPVEQTMSDLLAGATITRFSVGEVNRADVKTRFDTYAVGIASGVLTVELAQESEGIVPGSVETAPVPMAPPAAVPSALPSDDVSSLSVGTRTAAGPVRCDGVRNKRRNGVTRLEACGKLLAEHGPFVGTCGACKKAYPALAA